MSRASSNDCLAVVLFTALTWLAVQVFQGRGNALLLGVALGLGLLTKVYFLTAIVMLAVLAIRRPLARCRDRAGRRRRDRGLVVRPQYHADRDAFGPERSGGPARHGDRSICCGKPARCPGARRIDSILFSHLFFGGWSSLKVRSWMYHVFYWFIPFAGIGLVREKRRPEVQALAAIYFAFWIGQLYNVLLIFASKGVPTSMGWYLYAVIGAEVVLCVLGLQQLLTERFRTGPRSPAWSCSRCSICTPCTPSSIPYYTGLIRHRPNGALAAVHLADFRAPGLRDDLRTPYGFQSPARRRC